MKYQRVTERGNSRLRSPDEPNILQLAGKLREIAEQIERGEVAACIVAVKRHDQKARSFDMWCESSQEAYDIITKGMVAAFELVEETRNGQDGAPIQ